MKMEISLLADHPGDVEQIARWYFEEWAGKRPDASFAAVLENVALKAANRSAIPLSWVARESGRAVGAVELKLRESQDYPEYEHWLGGLFVSPEYRGRGYGNELIEAVVRYAVSVGVESLYLQCLHRHVSLYRKHGFSVLHDHPATAVMVRRKS